MTLRLQELLPPDIASRIKDFSLDQLIALRFASDDELPGLAAKVLNERIDDRKTIKQMIKHWTADHLRA